METSVSSRRKSEIQGFGIEILLLIADYSNNWIFSQIYRKSCKCLS